MIEKTDKMCLMMLESFYSAMAEAVPMFKSDAVVDCESTMHVEDEVVPAQG